MTQPCLSSPEIPSEYFVTFFGSSEQILGPDRYSRPSITMDFAGPLVLATFTNVPWSLPAEVMYVMSALAVE